MGRALEPLNLVRLFGAATIYGKLPIETPTSSPGVYSMSEDRIISPAATGNDETQFELSLRPKWLREYIGQSKAKSNLEIFIKAARKRGQALDHVLLYGAPGVGKTTLANIVANEMGSDIKSTAGPVIEQAGGPA